MNRDKLQPRFCRLLWHLAWKRSGHILKEKDKGKVNKKGNIAREKGNYIWWSLGYYMVGCCSHLHDSVIITTVITCNLCSKKIRNSFIFHFRSRKVIYSQKQQLGIAAHIARRSIYYHPWLHLSTFCHRSTKNTPSYRPWVISIVLC